MKHNLLAIALINSAKNRALKAEAMASAMYTDEQLDAAHTAMRNGTHQFYPAAAYYLEQVDQAWRQYATLMATMRRNQRDQRVGQLQLAI